MQQVQSSNVTHIHSHRKWYQSGGTKVTGSAFSVDGTFLERTCFSDYIEACFDLDRAETCFASLNGHFACIYEDAHNLVAGVDRIRSIPLFYAQLPDGGLLLSESATDIATGVGAREWDSTALCEFYATGYVFGSRTFAPGVRQLEAGQFLLFDKLARKVSVKYYYTHRHEPERGFDPGRFLASLSTIDGRIATRMLRRAQGRQIVVPLSGGYDSRYILSMLKIAGARDVVCYSYGRSSSFEVNTARAVAREMEYPFRFIEYTDEKWSRVLNSKLMARYTEYASQLCSLPHIQDLVAIEELCRTGEIEENAVVMPGYCGDLLGGSYIPLEVKHGVPERLLDEKLVEYIFRRHVDIAVAPFASEWRRKLLASIEQTVPHLAPRSVEEFVSLNEEWFTKEKVAKFVVNAVRLYEVVGLEWYLPLWDNELTDLWYRAPTFVRVDNQLYNSHLFDSYFIPLRIGFRKRESVSPSRARVDLKRVLPKPAQEAVRRLLNRITGRNRKVTGDFNAFAGIAKAITPHISCAGVDVQSPNINNHLAAWFLLQPSFGLDTAYSTPSFLPIAK
jgi:asparagine synthase (glutamine-hydrolysing)